jgi:hypothetical protein
MTFKEKYGNAPSFGSGAGDKLVSFFNAPFFFGEDGHKFDWQRNEENVWNIVTCGK